MSAQNSWFRLKPLYGGQGYFRGVSEVLLVPAKKGASSANKLAAHL